MPEELLTTFNYYSVSQVAAWLNVSNSALINRLTRLNRLDLLTSRKVKSCTRCGNIRFSILAVYCGVCGKYLHSSSRGLGESIIQTCLEWIPIKGALYVLNVISIENIKGDLCPHCNTGIFNLCSDKTCSYANPAYALSCEMCGKPTLYQEKFSPSYCDKYHGQPSMPMVECSH